MTVTLPSVNVFLVLVVIATGTMLGVALAVPTFGQWLLGRAWPGHKIDPQKRRADVISWCGIVAGCVVGGGQMALAAFGAQLSLSETSMGVVSTGLWGLWAGCLFVSAGGLSFLLRK